MTKDRVTGLLSLLLGIGVGIMTSQLPPSTMANDIGPAVFPYITACILIVCGAGLILKKPANTDAEPFFDRTALIRLAKISGVVVAYIVLEAMFGFLLPTIAVLFVLCMMFSKSGQTKWWQALIFSAAVAIIVYLLFTKGFSLVLPRGKLLRLF